MDQKKEVVGQDWVLHAGFRGVKTRVEFGGGSGVDAWSGLGIGYTRQRYLSSA